MHTTNFIHQKFLYLTAQNFDGGNIDKFPAIRQYFPYQYFPFN